jgi:hypothetical protein
MPNEKPKKAYRLDVDAYFRAVARGIDAEEEKASLFLCHKGSLGTAREAILSTVTPATLQLRIGKSRA